MHMHKDRFFPGYTFYRISIDWEIMVNERTGQRYLVGYELGRSI
jgi:hypothetical protein